MSYSGIDISAWQGFPDWAKVKASGKVQFVILKAGGSDAGCYTDSKFEYNYAQAKKHGVPVGAYYFVGSGCVTESAGIADAKRFLEIIKGKQFEYPVYIDVEVTPLSKKAGATAATKAFCKTMEDAGYYAGIYGSTYSTFQSRLNDSQLTQFSHWVAQYASSCTYWGDTPVWQYSSDGYVPGISGRVDMNYSYVDFPSIIKKLGRNGFAKTATTTTSSANKTTTTTSSTTTTKKTKIKEDGEWGTETTLAAQKKLKTTQDGIVSNQLNKYKFYMSACSETSFVFSDKGVGGSEMVKALQKLVGAKQDGYMGPVTIKKLQTYLNKEIKAGLDVDGKCGPKTVLAFQKWLNK